MRAKTFMQALLTCAAVVPAFGPEASAYTDGNGPGARRDWSAFEADVQPFASGRFSGPRSSAIVGAYPSTLEFGSRYWISSGKYVTNLFDTTGSAQLSRLDYGDLTARSAELFWRFSHDSGFFAKGYLGGGSVGGGKLNDEDFPPVTSPYSNTLSQQKDGSLRYLSVDLGYDVLSGQNYKVGGFAGYHYWQERLNGFGCRQVGGGDVCTPSAIGDEVNGLDQDSVWHSLRAGVAAEVEFLPGLKIGVDAAYVRGFQRGKDFHNLRPDISGLPQEGAGNGFMVDAILSYQVTSAMSVGVGGRWWQVRSDGNARFDKVPANGFSQVLTTEQDRYGMFLQASYKIGEPSSASNVASRTPAMAGAFWSGPYVGANIGYGFGRDKASYSGASAAGSASMALGVTRELQNDVAGDFAGGLVGYNFQSDRLIYGIEADAGYAHFGGSVAQTDAVTGIVSTVDQHVSWLGTVRGRVGRFAWDDTLVYGTAGVAFGGVNASGDVRQASTAACSAQVLCSTGSASKTAVGWTAGAGVEYKVTNWASIKLEGLYYDLGSVDVALKDSGAFSASSPFDYTMRTKMDGALVRSGLNLRF